MNTRKLVSIVTPTFNEEGNVRELYERICKALNGIDIDFEILFIDNASTDATVEILKKLAGEDMRVKVILNASNFGHIRSPYYGLLQAKGDAVIGIASDLQDPPELITELIEMWWRGAKIVLAVKDSTDENFFMRIIRRSYYKFLAKISTSPTIKNATGAGIFDRQVIDTLKELRDPYPYFRGLIVELGFRVETLSFHQPRRAAGETKNNFLTLYDMAILGITNNSKAPMRFFSLIGLISACLSLVVAFFYGLAKIFFWNSFDFGIAPLLFGVYFLGSLQLFLLGLLGEYLVALQVRIRNLPLVIEKERINF